MTTTLPLRRVADLSPAEPAPPLTHNQQQDERRLANVTEAAALVEAALGPVSGMTARTAFAAGDLTAAIAQALARAEDRGPDVPREVPELIEVFDYRPGDTPPPDPSDGGVIDPADYDQPTHGLLCPHCGFVTWAGEGDGIYVIDKGERWNRFGYEVATVDEVIPGYYEGPEHRWVPARPTGTQVEHRALVGGYGDGADMEGAGYACESCSRRVALPEGVEEEGS